MMMMILMIVITDYDASDDYDDGMIVLKVCDQSSQPQDMGWRTCTTSFKGVCDGNSIPAEVMHALRDLYKNSTN